MGFENHHNILAWWLFTLQQDDLQNVMTYTTQLASSLPSTIEDSMYNMRANISSAILHLPNQIYDFIASGFAYVTYFPSTIANSILNLYSDTLSFVQTQTLAVSSILSEIFPFLLRSLTALWSVLYGGIISFFSYINLTAGFLFAYVTSLFNTSSSVPYSESIQTISSHNLNENLNLYIKNDPTLKIDELTEAQILQITEMVLKNIKNRKMLELIVQQKLEDNISSEKYKAQIENIVQNNYNTNVHNNFDTLLNEILKNGDLTTLINTRIADKLNNNEILNEIETKLLELSKNNNILSDRITVLERRNIEFNDYIKNVGYDESLDFKTWILQHFSEDKQNLINLIKELRLSTSLDLEKLNNVQNTILLNIKNEFGNANIQNGDFSYAYVRKIVGDAIAIYDADKTGLADYALESGGGHVVSTRCTESYNARTSQYIWYGIPLWYNTNSPRTAITPNMAPGQCWAFQGFPGYLVIKLSTPIKVSGFTMEHISAKIVANGNIDSAPQNFSVWGLITEKDEDPALFGRYTYMDNTTTLQYFPVDNYLENEKLYEFVELRIESNHGNQIYTCLYRFRVHGYPNI